MNSQVRPELPTASVGSSQAPTAAVDNSAPFSNRPQSTYKSGNAVQTSGATSACSGSTDHYGSSNSPMTVISQFLACISRISRTVSSRRSSLASRCALDSQVAIASSVVRSPIFLCR
jgi:hypothetical protein